MAEEPESYLLSPWGAADGIELYTGSGACILWLTEEQAEEMRQQLLAHDYSPDTGWILEQVPVGDAQGIINLLRSREGVLSFDATKGHVVRQRTQPE